MFTIRLFDRKDHELMRRDADTLPAAKRVAKQMLSEAYLEGGETTHAKLGTHKVEIRDELGDVVWDRFYKRAPQRARAKR